MTRLIDRTTLKIALETETWMAVYCAEPERLIDVQMRYKDLVAIRKLIVRYCEEQSKVDLIHPIRCKDCKWYGRVDKRRFYRGADCLQGHLNTIVPDRDYCSRAEPKEADE